MATCREAYGKGWEGDFPNCVYTGTVESLGYGEELEGSTLEDDWQKYFDPYDPTEERQLRSAWSLKGEQLGSALGQKYAKTLGAGEKAKKKFGGAYSGIVETSIDTSLSEGQTAYEQAMKAGKLGLESGILGLQKDWKQEQRATLNMLYGRDIWLDDTEEDTNWDTTYEPFQENIVPADNEELARKSTCEARGGRWIQNRCDMDYGGG
jgi:hypothetical protein